MKLAVIALSAAAVIGFAPAVFAHGASSKTPGHEMQKYGKKAGHRASSDAPARQVRAPRSKAGSPGGFGHAPRETRDITDISTQAGGGGGGGSGM
jgi:hypothetical protein